MSAERERFSAAVTSSLHSNYLLNEFVLNVKNDRLDATLIIYIFFGRVYRCNFNFNFRQCNMIL